MIFTQKSNTSDENTHQAHFGFELININKPHRHYANDSIKKALTWHQEFFGALSQSSLNFSVTCKFRKAESSLITGSKINLRIAILFNIKAPSLKKATSLAEQLRDDLLVMFHPGSIHSHQPYVFAAIENHDHLAEFTRSPVKTTVYEYQREPVTLKRNAVSLGYAAKNDGGDALDYIPRYFMPDIFTLYNFARCMDYSTSFMEVSLMLRPVRLTRDQVAFFKKATEDYVIADKRLTDKEKLIHEENLKLLYKKNTSLFLFHVQLEIPSDKQPRQTFVDQIAESFFGNASTVELVKTTDADHFHKICTNQVQDLVTYIYPREIVQHCFHLPVLNGEHMHWFPSHSDAFVHYPPELPERGVLMGMKNTYHRPKEIRITQEELAQHLYILGQTGTGKTTLLKSMILDQIRNKDGVCVVDPHGDLVSMVYSQIPPERQKDVVYFDPTSTKEIKINILDWHPDFPEQRTFIFNELIRIIDEIYDLQTTGGPMFEQFFKNALLLVMEARGTLEDFYRFFFDKNYRQELMEHAKLNLSVDFFKSALKLKGEASFEHFAGYITSKVNRFVQDDFISPIINHRKSNICFRHILDNQKILLIRLPKGRLGRDGVKFMGTLLFNRIVMAAFTRENTNEKERTPFYMYIDEFQNFANDDIETALSESRKYGLRMILANQTLNQLPEKMVRTLLGNVGNQVFFRPGPFDIDVIAPYFKHYVDEHELLNLENFHALTRLMNKHKPLKPFILETICG